MKSLPAIELSVEGFRNFVQHLVEVEKFPYLDLEDSFSDVKDNDGNIFYTPEEARARQTIVDCFVVYFDGVTNIELVQFSGELIEEFTPEYEFEICVEWKSYGYITVNAKSLEDAIDEVRNNHKISDVTNEEVIEDSFEVDERTTKEENHEITGKNRNY